MAVLTVQSASLTGLAPNMVAAGSTNTFVNADAKNTLMVKNGGASATSVTITSVTKCNQGFSHDVTVSVAAGATQIIGPFPTNRFNAADGSNIVSVAVNPVDSVTLAVLRIS